MTSSVSVIIPALNEGDNLVETVGCVLKNTDVGRLEVFVVDDGSRDGSARRAAAVHGNGRLHVINGGSLGIARARNEGARHASGDVLVFLDAHCYVPPGWIHPLLETLEGDDVALAGPAFTSIRDVNLAGCGSTWKDESLETTWLPCATVSQPVPFLPGGCHAVRADVFRDVGGYDEGMTRWGSEDVEFSLRVWLAGYRVFGAPGSLVYHLFRQRQNYTVDGAGVLYNRLRMAYVHLDESRLARCLRRLLACPGVEKSLAMLASSDTMTRRLTWMHRRKYDVAWLCERFNMIP